MKTSTSLLLLGLGWLGLGPVGLPPAVAAIPEPDSLFYGRIINRTSGQEFQLVEGDVSWTLRRPDGSLVVIRAPLEPLLDGQFSYRCKVPHQALALGVGVSDHVVPLAASLLQYDLVDIQVNGFPALVLPPAEEQLVAAQPDRASTYRVDLEVFDPLLDSDGDGIPDWWEDRHGIDNPNDDRDGDGWNAAGEFDRGSDPDKDDRLPSLLHSEFTVYAEGTSGLNLVALDSDSAAGDLVYTLLTLPAHGTLHLRNAVPDPAAPDLALGAGDLFRQADVDEGRLVFVHAGPSSSAVADAFTLSLRDEDPAHDAFEGQITLQVYRPAGDLSEGAAAEALATMPQQLPAFEGISDGLARMMTSYLLGREQGYILWDASRTSGGVSLQAASSDWTEPAYETLFVASFGPEKPQVLTGGAGPDHLSGGMARDVLIGGGESDRLTGRRGADLFVLGSVGEGDDVIADFDPADGDVIDLSQSLNGTSGWLRDYVQVSNDGVDSHLRVDADGDGGGFTDRTVTLEGQLLEADDLFTLVEQGALVTGDKVLPPRVTIVATEVTASESGPVPGAFLLRRTGATEGTLTINLHVTGSALNGTDYAWVSPSLTFAAGEAEQTLVILPFADTLTELAEVVEVIIVAGTGYEVGDASRAQLWIEDLAPRLTLETLESPAVRDPQRPGYLVLTRSGVLDRSVLVRLAVDGTAAVGSDYEDLPGFVNLDPFQTSHLIEIRPKPSAELNDGAESVVLEVRPDSSYALGSPSVAGLMIVDHEQTLAEWMQTEYPGTTLSPAEFADADPDGSGILGLDRYAYQLNMEDPAGSRSLPRFEMVDGHLQVSFREHAALRDVQFVVEVSEDMERWFSGPSYVDRLNAFSSSLDPEARRFRSTRSSDESPFQVMRVRIVLQP